MNEQFYFLLGVILISRLVFTFEDGPIDKTRTILMTVLQIMGLMVYQIQFTLGALGITLLAINVAFYFLENRTRRASESRLLSLLAHVTILSIFFSPWINLNFNPGLSTLLQTIARYSLLFTAMEHIDWLNLSIISLGLLFVINEANIITRYLFQVFHLSPLKADKNGKTSGSVDGRELNTGRIIGIVERILIYYLVLNGQFAAIGLVLAAKSFARYKEMDKREFAEYVLIGTLISTVLAIISAGAIQLLLPPNPATLILHYL